MTKIITENFKTETTHSLFDSLASDNYYVMASTSLSATEFDQESTITNTQFDKRDFQKKVIFANRVTQDNARYMFFEKPWLRGTVYDEYDDTKDIEQLNMYVTVQEDQSEDFMVLKCLNNNNGTASDEVPGSVDAKNYRVVTTQDGYVWQYMFTVKGADAQLYRTANSLPLPLFTENGGGYGDPDVVANAKEDISRIEIESTPIGQFNQYLFGAATSQADSSSVQTIESKETSTSGVREITVSTTALTGRSLYVQNNAYKNMYLRHNTSGKLYDVIASETIQNNLKLTVRTGDTADSFTPDENGAIQCQLVIKILVSNSTLGFNTSVTPKQSFTCKAYGVLDQNGTLKQIAFETRGENYKTATAQVVYPPLLKSSVLASGQQTILRAVVSPKGGHGSDPISELAMSRLSVVTNFSGQNAETPNANTYTIVGLVKNPLISNASGSSTIPTDNQANHRIDNRLNILVQGNATAKISADNYIEQYIKTIDLRLAVQGQSYTIVDNGNMSTQDFTNIGAADSNIGTVFTANANIANLDGSKIAQVAYVVDKVDVNDPDYDYNIEVISARVHQVHAHVNNVHLVTTPANTDGNTKISLVDYYGNFQHKFQKGIFYIKEKESSTISINNETAHTINYGEYEVYSGDLLHFIDFAPITREAEKTEKIKFTFDF